MAKSKGPKVYAVARGRVPGIYNTWSECQSQTSGHGGAIFKSFKTHVEAQAFMQANSSSGSSSASANQSKKRNENRANNTTSKRQKKVAAASGALKKEVSKSDAQVQITIHFDGGSRGNPGLAGAGAEVVVLANDDPAGGDPPSSSTTTTTHLIREYCGAKETNNYAEYNGLLAGLKQAKICIEQYSSKKSSAPTTSTKALFQLQIYGDSKLIIQQLRGAWQCRHANIRPLFQECQKLIGDMKGMDSLSEVLYDHVYRENNKVADAMANEAMDTLRSWITSTTDASSKGHVTNTDGEKPGASFAVTSMFVIDKNPATSSRKEFIDVDGSDNDSHLSC